MKQSKKGISLAFVIVVVMALMIFSAMLFSAASHSLNMTGTSTEGRQAYLTAKSAIEYAKTLAYDKAKSGGKLVPFSVGHDADGNYAELAAATAPNGTDCYAECTNPGGDGKNWKILAKVKYQNSGQYRQLAYTFTLNWNASVSLPASDFLACGIGYGSQRVFDNSGFWPEMKSITASDYPIVEGLPIAVNANPTSVTAPEILLMGDTNLRTWEGSDLGHYSLVCVDNARGSIHSDRICIGSDIYTEFTSYTSWQKQSVISSTAVVGLYPNTQGATTGVIYFAGNNGGNCTVKRNGSDGPFKAAVAIPSGYYSFEAGFDICSIVADPHSNAAFLDSYGGSGAKKMTKITDTASLQNFQQDVNYVEGFFAKNQLKIISGAEWSPSKGANFESNGVFAGNPTEPSRHNGNHWNVYNSSGDYNLDENAVFTYANSTGWPSSAAWPQYLDPYGNMIDTNDGTHPNAKKYIIYAAKQFFLRFVSRSEDFKLPPASDVYNVAFNSDLVSLSMAVSDTDAGADADHRPKIVQANDAPSSQFLLTSLSTDENGNHKDVTLVIPNSIDVLYQNGSKSYHIPQGVYQVKSGFNFFDNDVENWTKFWSDYKKANYPISDSGDSGDSGGSGGFTISGGKYTDS
jgi:hypothetical protein